MHTKLALLFTPRAHALTIEMAPSAPRAPRVATCTANMVAMVNNPTYKGDFPEFATPKGEPMGVHACLDDIDAKLPDTFLLRDEGGVVTLHVSGPQWTVVSTRRSKKARGPTPSSPLSKATIQTKYLAIMSDFSGTFLGEEAVIAPHAKDPAMVDIHFVHSGNAPVCRVPLNEAILNLGLRWEATSTTWTSVWMRGGDGCPAPIDLKRVQLTKDDFKKGPPTSGGPEEAKKRAARRAKILKACNVSSIHDLSSFAMAIARQPDAREAVARGIFAHLRIPPGAQGDEVAEQGAIFLSNVWDFLDTPTLLNHLNDLEGDVQARGAMLLDRIAPQPSRAPREAHSRVQLGRCPPRPSQKARKPKRTTVATDPPHNADPPSTRPLEFAPPRPSRAREAVVVDSSSGDDSPDRPHRGERRPRAPLPLASSRSKRQSQHDTTNGRSRRRLINANTAEPSDDEEMQDGHPSDDASTEAPILRLTSVERQHEGDDSNTPGARRYRIPKRKPPLRAGSDYFDGYELQDSHGSPLFEEDFESDGGQSLDGSPRREASHDTRVRPRRRLRAPDGSDGALPARDAHRNDFAGLVPGEHVNDSAETKLALIAERLDVDGAALAEMLAAAAGSTGANDGCWNSSAALRARQAAKDYIAAKERLRNYEHSVELDSTPDDWEAVVNRMSDIRALTQTFAPPRGTREDSNHSHRIVCAESTSANFQGGTPATTLDKLCTHSATEIQRVIAQSTSCIKKIIHLTIVQHSGGAAWAYLYSNGYSRGKASAHRMSASIVGTRNSLWTTLEAVLLRMVTGGSELAGELERLSESARQSVLEGIMLGRFKLNSIIVALGGRVPTPGAATTPAIEGLTPFEAGELGCLEATKLFGCLTKALDKLERLIYYAHVELGGGVDYKSPDGLGLSALWVRVRDRLPFYGEHEECGFYVMDLALERLGRRIYSKRYEPTSDPLELTTAVEQVRDVELANVESRRANKEVLRAALARELRQTPRPPTSHPRDGHNRGGVRSEAFDMPTAAPAPRVGAKQPFTDPPPPPPVKRQRTDSTHGCGGNNKPLTHLPLTANSITRFWPVKEGQPYQRSVLDALDILIQRDVPHANPSPCCFDFALPPCTKKKCARCDAQRARATPIRPNRKILDEVYNACTTEVKTIWDKKRAALAPSP